MAEEKKKEADGKAEEGKKKKKGLPAIVMIAVGAIVGGAGVVFAVPPKEKIVKVEEKPHELIDVRHPDEIQHEFNPKSRGAGRGFARVSFKFVYTVRDDLVDQAFEQIKAHWEDAKSLSLEVFSNRSYEELQSESGRRVLEMDLMHELERAFFPTAKGEAPIARVTRINWQRRLMQ